jgi:hypothetical protein
MKAKTGLLRELRRKRYTGRRGLVPGRVERPDTEPIELTVTDNRYGDPGHVAEVMRPHSGASSMLMMPVWQGELSSSTTAAPAPPASTIAADGSLSPGSFRAGGCC